MLHFTNGQSAVDLLTAGGIEGQIMSWDDVLHEGPVPAGISLYGTTNVRIAHLAEIGFGEMKDLIKRMYDRDIALEEYADQDELVLWFEHDLYDQLQLLQILDFVAETPAENTKVSLIQTDDFISHMTPADMKPLFEKRVPVTKDQLELAQKAWHAFRYQTPELWAGILQLNTKPLPYLSHAIYRHLAQYPHETNGLSMTEEIVLTYLQAKATKAEHCTAGELFKAYTKSESAAFMGDLSFWQILKWLVDARDPLVKSNASLPLLIPPAHPQTSAFLKQRLSITDTGKAVLAGERDWVDIEPTEKWLGGVEFVPGRAWRWNRETLKLVSPEDH